MKKFILGICLLTTFIFSSSFVSDSSLHLRTDSMKNKMGIKKFITFKFKMPVGFTETYEVDQFIGEQAGILTSRTDSNTQVYFATFTAESGLTPESFRAWFTSRGLAVAYGYTGDLGVDSVLDLYRAPLSAVQAKSTFFTFITE